MQKSKASIAACLMIVVMTNTVAGCSLFSRPAAPIAGGSCTWVEPIRPTCADIVTPALKLQIITHNTMWAKERGVPLPPIKKNACQPKPAAAKAPDAISTGG